MRLSGIAEVYQGLARSGRGAGRRTGQWSLRLVESGDIQFDGWLNPVGLREIEVPQNRRIERHLLRPYDVLITARTGSVQLALVPPEVPRTVAGVTLLVVRAREPESGMGHYLWYFLTSAYGRGQLVKRLTVNADNHNAVGQCRLRGGGSGADIRANLTEVVRLVEASEEAYASAVEAAVIRRETVRDSVIRQFIAQGTDQRF